MKLVLITPTTGPGGSERVLAWLANIRLTAGDHVVVLSFEPKTAIPFHTFTAGVDVRFLGLQGNSTGPIQAIGNNLARLKRLRTAVAGLAPHAVVAFTTEAAVLTILACAGLGLPIAAAERADPAVFPLGRWWRRLRSAAYPWANLVLAQTEAAAALLPGRPVVIPNPVRRPSADAEPEFQVPAPFVLGVGRFTAEKGFDLLVSAFAIAARSHPSWRLVVAGAGPEQPRLKKLAVEAGLSDRVVFPGVVHHPEALMMRAALFVLPSRSEGFPNALCEAMACGCAVIATACSAGPRSIVQNDIDGVLVAPDDIDSLAAAMERLMGDKATRTRLGREAVRLTERYSEDRIAVQWDKALASLVAP